MAASRRDAPVRRRPPGPRGRHRISPGGLSEPGPGRRRVPGGRDRGLRAFRRGRGRAAQLEPQRKVRMSRMGRIGVLVLAFGLGLAGASQAADVPSRTYNAPIDRVWAVTQSVLKSLGWDIDKSDRAVGWILTDSRGVEFKDYAVYGKGLRHQPPVAV